MRSWKDRIPFDERLRPPWVTLDAWNVARDAWIKENPGKPLRYPENEESKT